MSTLDTRPPAVAGMFYPSAAATLRATVDELLANAPAVTMAQPKAIIAPHAGYIYSGPTAARIYAALAPWRGSIRRVVLLGPTHRLAVRGLALPSVRAFATPLGAIPLDTAAMAQLDELPQIGRNDAAHALEHSLEVHLPFLQRALDTFTLIPLAVGNAEPEAVAEVLDQLWGGDETLLVISSDLSHFLPYATAQQVDSNTCQHILALDTHIHPEQACGAYPINGLLLAAQRRGLQAQLIDLCNSGDTAGDRERVVGYAAFAFTRPTMDEIGTSLLRLARNAIGERFGLPPQPVVESPKLQDKAATFVTLTQHGVLRGCIGSLEAWRPLAEDVCANALAAAFCDPRFPPLTADELPRTRLEISLLTPAQVIDCRDEADALAQLRPHIDGVIFSAGRHRATFLPQVWEQLPEPAAFLAQLKRKAGLGADYWSPEARLARYTVKKWQEVAP
ncbi:MAG: TIGR00296 family protein [Betaproteobacteria bacterium HGW-Betaproteobacteria-7]|jgi:hypothetical protein|nr:MAG: TIGR00296 family protein [Betaproteobacteria bacterium HGW-Betaproteobacteria-7]